jgi:ABC-type nickel/cobalt efflux system permease component RcnA
VTRSGAERRVPPDPAKWKPARRKYHAPLQYALATLAGIAVILLLTGAFEAMAQSSPFGMPRPPQKAPAPPPDGIVGWILAKQAEFSVAMRAMLRNAKADGSAVWGLLGLSFLYGIFHAAGPGHGKAVISSYVVANHETWRRGVVLSFASAMLQAIVAVVFVGVAAWVFNATMSTMCKTERWIEIVSYALIALIGLRLVWVKGRAFFNTARNMSRPLHAVGAAVTPHDHKHNHKHDRDHHGHDHHHHDHDHHHHGHDHHHGGGHASAWGHAHGPEPQDLAGPGGWRRGLAAIVAVGLRPCSGAILVLVFALAQGMLWVGVAATFVMGLGTAITVAAIATLAVGARSLAQGFANSPSGYGMLALRGIETGAALIILAFGSLLLLGYLTSERLPLC